MEGGRAVATRLPNESDAIALQRRSRTEMFAQELYIPSAWKPLASGSFKYSFEVGSISGIRWISVCRVGSKLKVHFPCQKVFANKKDFKISNSAAGSLLLLHLLILFSVQRMREYSIHDVSSPHDQAKWLSFPFGNGCSGQLNHIYCGSKFCFHSVA